MFIAYNAAAVFYVFLSKLHRPYNILNALFNNWSSSQPNFLFAFIGIFLIEFFLCSRLLFKVNQPIWIDKSQQDTLTITHNWVSFVLVLSISGRTWDTHSSWPELLASLLPPSTVRPECKTLDFPNYLTGKRDQVTYL